MSDDFLRSYTIPTRKPDQLQENETEPAKSEADNQTTDGTTNLNRFVPPGRQGDEYFNAKLLNQRKRPHNSGLVKTDSLCTEGKIPIPIFTGRDSSYPDDLNMLIKPFFCELCKVQMNSKNTAISHYESKQHDRKIQAWLSEHYPNNPPPVKRFVKDGPTGPEALRCELCDLPLTSLSHAKQHYAGRKHRSVALQKSDPSGKGYYDSEGKWVRTGTKKFPTNNGDSRFGIGEDFVATSVEPETGVVSETTTTIAVSPKANSPLSESIHCPICNIYVTSATQMTSHLSGAKHKKKMTAASADSIVVPQEVANGNSILATINSDVNPLEDLSMYRTPTGFFYCQICNTTMNHESVLHQHIQGKKHKIKAKANQGKN